MPMRRMSCTDQRELAELRGSPRARGHIRARADFDVAGLTHMHMILGGVPNSAPWRMGVADYEASLPESDAVRLDPTLILETPWEPALAQVMRAAGSAAFEEALIPELLADLHAQRSSPSASAKSSHEHPAPPRNVSRARTAGTGDQADRCGAPC